MIFKTETLNLFAILKNLREITNEFKLKINKEGLSITEINPENICLIDVILRKEKLSEFNYTEDLIYCFNTEDFYNCLKNNKKTDASFNIENEKAILTFSNGIKSELVLLDYEKSNLKTIPILQFNTEIEINAKKFKEIIKNFSNISDKLQIDLKPRYKEEISKKETPTILSLIAKSPLNSSQIDLNEDEIFINSNCYPAKSNYSLEYLNLFLKEMITEKIILKLSNDYPLMLSFKMPYFEINYILAPRIEED